MLSQIQAMNTHRLLHFFYVYSSVSGHKWACLVLKYRVRMKVKGKFGPITQKTIESSVLKNLNINVPSSQRLSTISNNANNNKDSSMDTNNPHGLANSVLQKQYL